MVIKDLKIESLKEYKNNPRHNDDAVAAVAESIREFGFKVPIVVDRNNVIVAGHTRLKAARLLGMETVPCVVADDLTEDQVKAFRLADNKTAELAEWDMEKLEAELAQLADSGIDMTDFGFDELEVEPPEIIEDEVPEVDEENEPITKRGQIWKLGNHYLLCGDATSSEDVYKLMSAGGVSVEADLVVTDPPYNMAYEGAGNTPDSQRKKNKILNDKMPDAEFEKFLTSSYSQMYEAMKDGASCYVFYKELGKGVFITAMEAGGLTFKQELIWVKSQLVLGGSKYQSIYEPCLFGCKGESIAFWYAGRKETSVIEDVDLMNEFELRLAIKELMESLHTDIVREKKQLKNDLHPTMKPVKLLVYFIRNSSKEGDVVFDPFGGSGTTLIAAEQTGRRCRMLELDPKYCDVIVKRWEALTDRKAELVEAGV